MVTWSPCTLAECYISKNVVANVPYLMMGEIKRRRELGNYTPTSSNFLTFPEPLKVSLPT